MSLAFLEQSDFGAGSQLEVAPHLIDPRGFNNTENGLLDEDGSAYKRGGATRFSNAAFGTKGKWVWEGELSVGRRTVVANAVDFGVTATDNKGTAIVNLGGAGFPTEPHSAVFFQHMLFIGGGIIYGGSRKAADYSTGTVTVTNGSKAVKGAGTAWVANVDAGMLLRLGSGKRAYVVAEVVSNTELVLFEAYEEGTEAGHAYTLKRLEEATSPYKSASFYLVCAERLIVMSGRRVDFSEPQKPHLYKATIFPEETVVENFHELQEGIVIRGGFSLGIDKLMVCHTGGITSFSNMARSIVDGNGNTQHREDVYSRDVVLWGQMGIAASRSTMVIPAIDNIYLVDAVSGPAPIGDAILPRLRERLAEGAIPGGAWVTRQHYFLPLLSTTGVPLDLLVCRLDKPYAYRNKTLYPWSFLAGKGAEIAGAAVRHPRTSGEAPRVLGIGADGNLLDLLPYFEPDVSNSTDHDGTVPTFSLLLRDYSVPGEPIVRWRKLQLFYELWPIPEGEGFLTPEEPPFEGEEDPEVPTEEEGDVTPGVIHAVVTAELGTGIRQAGLPLWDEVEWDEFLWAGDDDGEFEILDEGAPPNAGLAGQFAQNDKTWFSRKSARRVRYRISSADPVAKLIIRGVKIGYAEPGGARRSRVS
jgi:hypothetical protein